MSTGSDIPGQTAWMKQNWFKKHTPQVKMSQILTPDYNIDMGLYVRPFSQLTPPSSVHPLNQMCLIAMNSSAKVFQLFSVFLFWSKMASGIQSWKLSLQQGRVGGGKSDSKTRRFFFPFVKTSFPLLLTMFYSAEKCHVHKRTFCVLLLCCFFSHPFSLTKFLKKAKDFFVLLRNRHVYSVCFGTLPWQKPKKQNSVIIYTFLFLRQFHNVFLMYIHMHFTTDNF